MQRSMWLKFSMQAEANFNKFKSYSASHIRIKSFITIWYMEYAFDNLCFPKKTPQVSIAWAKVSGVFEMPKSVFKQILT